MTSVQFVLQPLPGSDEQFIERIKEVSEKINKLGFGSHRTFEQLKIPVKEIVIGPNHIGILLEDGKAFRVAFSINSERIDLSKSDNIKSANGNAPSANIPKNNGPSRPMARSRARLMRTTGRSVSGGQGSRSTGVIIGGATSSRPLVTVPATYVPEELISQAEVVLQGKSRNLIIRELQRTNLDVNLAVNNLLSRDDEDADDADESTDNYVPEDLISLLDNGFHGENNSVIIDPSDGLFSEEIFSNYSSIRNLLFDRIRSERNQQANASNSESNQSNRSSNTGLSTTSSLSAQISTVGADREAFSRWRDRQYYSPRRWMNKEEYTWEKDSDSKKKDVLSLTSPIWISEELQPWSEKNTIRFKKIAALYSEFIGLSENGDLHQWKWADNEPFRSEVDNIYHPKTLGLNITEKVEHLAANFIRCSVVTENNRVATWMDEQLGYLGAKLEHAAITFNEFIMDPIQSVNVCSLYTAVRTENNNIYWWGVLPFDQRRYLWDKFRSKSKKPLKLVTSDIQVGSQVVMKKCPIYQSGSIGFTCVNGVPKVGQLLNSVWDFSDVCRFKIVKISTYTPSDQSQVTTIASSIHSAEKDSTKSATVSNMKSTSTNSNNKETTDRIDMPPPPSPASSTCSDTGSVTSHKRAKKLTTKEDSNSSQENKSDEELWQLKDVVFVEDKIGPIGKVLKVDGDYVAVRFPATTNPISAKDDAKDDDWQQCRLLRREDIQVYKTAINSRGTDWLQKIPKKINISSNTDMSTFQLLAMAADTRGIHIIKKVGSRLHYSLYNLYNSKQEQNSQFPTDSVSFIGASANKISMICNNDSNGDNSTIILRDGNGALYPLAKDCSGAIKDPHWFDLPPVKDVTMTTLSLPSLGSCGNLKSKICITAILFGAQKLMPHILRCDIKNSFVVLNRLDKESRSDVLSVVEERCDGNRNIFHACVVMCSPTSNKDSSDIVFSNDKKGSISSFALSRSSGSTSAYGNISNTNANGMSDSSSFATVSPSLGSGNPNSINRESRITLRDMMHRLISSDQIDQQSTGGTNTTEDHAMPPMPWSMDPNNINISSAHSISDNNDDDLSKLIGVSATSTSSKIFSSNSSFDPIQRREHAILILQQMCASVALQPFLHELLSSKDAQGQTPFMLAVHSRAYEAGIILLNTILTLSENEPSLKDSMIFPAGSPPDQSPLHVICYNDTCSFTWTGADHINQNIFECRTCGLTGSLCCCTECARVCHKGHDCKLKRTSPTAYCDCWEKCKCKALIAGNLNKRFALLCKLASCTDLVTKFNSKGESILLFLIQTVGRQTVEQRQYRFSVRVRNNANSASTNSSTNPRKSGSVEIDSDMPEHDLEPPKFARKALERLLVDWHAIRAMIMTGTEKLENFQQQKQPNSAEGSHTESYNIYLQTQHGSTLMDKFTHSLFVKCSGDHLDTLLLTLVRELQNDTVPGRIKEAEEVARRFVRSVARVYVIFNLEKQPSPERRKSHIGCNKHIQSCVKVFQTLHKISIEELCEVSEALITPVRLGVVRPTAPFMMSSSNLDNSDDLFCVEPLAPTSNLDAASEINLHNLNRDQSGTFNIQQRYSIDGIDPLREAPEAEETSNREVNVQGQEDDIIDNVRNEEVIQDDESDNDFTFNDAETESDSDDNNSNQDAQRSVQTGATVGSETDIGVLFLEDESSDSSPQDEDVSDDGETDEHSDEFNYNEQQLERRTTNSNNRNDLAPQTMQWAIRSRDTGRSTVRVPAGSNLVFIDPMALRRSTVPTSTTVSNTPPEQLTMATTASNLARAFGILLRQISDLLSQLSHNVLNEIEASLQIRVEEAIEVQMFAEKRLKHTWDWMFSVMDGTEAQLKFGAYLTNYTDPTHPLHPLNLSPHGNTNPVPSTQAPSSNSSVGINVSGPSSRRDFFTYCLSLMRAHTSEHRDALPVLDITALRHIAYVLDAFIYYMRNDSHFYERYETLKNSNNVLFTGENVDIDDEITMLDDNIPETHSLINSTHNSRKHSFFTRSDSTLSLGCLAPENFDLPLDVSIPLADKPHLLQPNSKRQDLFANLPLLSTNTNTSNANNKRLAQNTVENIPTKLSFSSYFRNTENLYHQANQANDNDGIQQKSSSITGLYDDSTKPILNNGESNIEQHKKAVRIFDKSDSSSDSNVYVQLKKKQCLDESKIQNDASTSSKSVLMETDEVEMNDVRNSDVLMTSRPEVIVTPNKNHFRSNEKSSTLQSSSTTLSTNRSVIVRAGGSFKRVEETSLTSEQSTPSSLVTENRTVFTNRSLKKTQVVSFPVRGSQFCKSCSTELPSWNFLLSRWKLALDLFGRVFMDDVGMEHSSVLPELRGFPVKEIRFRRHMEKLRNGQQRDLILCKLERNRDSLILQTFKELNAQFGNQNRRIQPPLTFNRVKVTFKDEPGEGSGVARSFYTSIAEALLANAKVPNLESVQVGNNNSKYGVPFSSILRNRGNNGQGRDQPTLQRRGTGSKILWRTSRDRKTLNIDARPFVPLSNFGDNSVETANDNLSVHLQQLGERLYPKIHSINSANAPKITGMLLEIPTPQLLSILSSDDTLRQKVNEAVEIIAFKQKSEINTSSNKKSPSIVMVEPIEDDNEPLFYSPGKRGFYTPRQGFASFERINAFRNIGRLIGLCLLQNELLPLFLQRHVLKYILGRKIKFHDLAFFDPALYESFRQIIQSLQTEEGQESINRMELCFVIDLMKEEGSGNQELIPGGRDIPVTSANIFEYIRRYTEYRLIKSQEKALEALKDGVFDVLPDNCMINLTSEDLRLLMNGVGDINVSTLISYTTFNDESSEGSDKLLKFKRWFWSIVEKMNISERQDLVYFWTGSPALPASEEGFQPLPSVTIRPADDSHLPTANTCISRLYIPLYSSKSILRSKLLLAIKSKNFGFV